MTYRETKENGNPWYYVAAYNGFYIVASAKSKKGFEQAKKNLLKRIK